MANNPVRWFEIYVQDMARARRFYETVFATTLARLNSPGIEMWAFPQVKDLVGTSGALVHVPGVPSGGHGTLVYFGCADCAVDTEGNMFGLHSMG
jgi:hypothetical protein